MVCSIFQASTLDKAHCWLDSTGAQDCGLPPNRLTAVSQNGPARTFPVWEQSPGTAPSESPRTTPKPGFQAGNFTTPRLLLTAGSRLPGRAVFCEQLVCSLVTLVTSGLLCQETWGNVNCTAWTQLPLRCPGRRHSGCARGAPWANTACERGCDSLKMQSLFKASTNSCKVYTSTRYTS